MAVSDALTDKLKAINARYRYVRSKKMFFDIAHRIFLRRHELLTALEAQYAIVADKQLPCGPKWLAWDSRAEVDRVVFEPERPRNIPYSQRGYRMLDYNIWEPSGVQPSEGDVSLWITLLQHLCRRAEDRLWIERWCAHSVRKTREKLFTAIVLWGPGGAGKNLLGEVIAPLHGFDAAVTVNHDQLFDRFNKSMLMGRTLIIGEEIGSGDRRDANRVKSMITRTTFSIEEKNEARLDLGNYTSFILSSNESIPIHIDKGDRRFFVIKAENPLPSQLGAAIFAWSRSSAGSAALLHHLTRIDLSGFHANESAPMTVDKENLTEDGRSLEASIANEAMEDAAKGDRPELVPISALFEEQDAHTKQKISDCSLGRALRQEGAILLKSRPRLGDGKRARVWCLIPERYPQWEKASETAIRNGLKKAGAAALQVVTTPDQALNGSSEKPAK